MYVIIAGAGRVGFHIASLLVEEGHEVAIMEESEAVMEVVRRQLDVRLILGNAATPVVLRAAEVHRADLIIAVTNSDEANMLACFLAKESGVAVAAARVRNPEYSGYFVTPAKSPTATRKIIRVKSLGIDVFINPEFEAAKEITNLLRSFYSTPAVSFAEGRIQIREFAVGEEAVAVKDKLLQEIDFPRPCAVAAVSGADGIYMPTEDKVLKEGDRVFLIAEREHMTELAEKFAQPQHPARNVVVFGGSYTGFLVAERLQRHGVSVKVIDDDLRRCEEIAAKLEGITVLNGDGADRDFLIEQGIPSADAFVATTSSDEINILSGLLAKSLGVPRNLIIVDKPSYISLAEAVGVNVAASLPLLTASKIAHFVLHGGAVSAAFLGGERVQAVEFVVSPSAAVVGRSVSDSGLPKEAVVGAVIHQDEVFIPPAAAELEVGDHVLVVAPLSVFSAVEKQFK